MKWFSFVIVIMGAVLPASIQAQFDLWTLGPQDLSTQIIPVLDVPTLQGGKTLHGTHTDPYLIRNSPFPHLEITIDKYSGKAVSDVKIWVDEGGSSTLKKSYTFSATPTSASKTLVLKKVKNKDILIHVSTNAFSKVFKYNISTHGETAN